MKIRQFALGDYQTNSYVLRSTEQSDKCVIIDTGFDFEQVTKYLQKEKLHPEALLLTHGHIDHIAGIELLRKHNTKLKIYIHQQDAEMFADGNLNLSAMMGMSYRIDPADFLIEYDEFVNEANIELKVIHTPGHTPGSVSLYSDKDYVLFTGDTLFAGSVGRTDFPGGSFNSLIKSIKENLLTLPPETKVLPGHGPATTIKMEKDDNQFLI